MRRSKRAVLGDRRDASKVEQQQQLSNQSLTVIDEPDNKPPL